MGRPGYPGLGRRGFVSQGAVWPDMIIVLSPLFDQHLRLQQSVEDFAIEQFIPHAAVEGFDVAVFPWASWLDIQRGYANNLLQPLP